MAGGLSFSLQASFIQGYTLNRAWQEIPIGTIVALVDTVRTRVLQLALELRGDLNDDDNAMPPPELVERSVQTIIYGGTNLVGSITGNVQLIGQQVVVEGNFGSLATALKTFGIQTDKVDGLEQAIEADKIDGADKGFGTRVAAWMQNAGSYIGKEGLKVGFEVAQKAATQAVLNYFGLPT